MGAHRFTKRQTNNRPNQLFLCVGSKVLLTKNLKQAAVLVKRSTEIVKDIIYAENDTPTNNLPMYIIVDFDNTYTGKYFFGNDQYKRRWVPIKLMMAEFLTDGSKKYVKHTCTQVPLKLSWGLTVWKAQGGTFKDFLN